MFQVKHSKYLRVYIQLYANPRLLEMTDMMMQTPLHWAIKRSDFKMVELLMAFGANVHAQDNIKRDCEDIVKPDDILLRKSI